MNMIEALKRAKEEGITVSPKVYPKRVCYFVHERKGAGFFEEHDNVSSEVKKGEKPYRWVALEILFESDVLGEWVQVEPHDPELYKW